MHTTKDCVPLLHQSSHHPETCKKGSIYSQMLRYRRIITHDKECHEKARVILPGQGYKDKDILLHIINTLNHNYSQTVHPQTTQADYHLSFHTFQISPHITSSLVTNMAKSTGHSLPMTQKPQGTLCSYRIKPNHPQPNPTISPLPSPHNLPPPPISPPPQHTSMNKPQPPQISPPPPPNTHNYPPTGISSTQTNKTQ